MVFERCCMRTKDAFLALVRAGMWEKSESVSCGGLAVLNSEVLRLAKEQSIVGLVAAGMEKLPTGIVPLTEKLTLLGKCQLIEQRNVEMNRFIAKLMLRLRESGIDAILAKGQGVAQCYERPLWRSCGDVDLLLDRANYENAKSLLTPIASHVDPEDKKKLHQGMTISQWTVELHGALHVDFSKKIDSGIDEVQRDIIENNGVRIWDNNGVDILLPNANNDVLVVFTHFIEHFYVGGVGLRQVCDWCRLLWTFRNEIDRPLLESRLQTMGLMSEWKAFASLAVNHLGMPEEAMPFYDKCYRRRGEKVLSHVLKSGNLGHNNNQRYRSILSKPLANTITFFRRIGDFTKFTFIFPVDAPKFFATYVFGKFNNGTA